MSLDYQLCAIDGILLIKPTCYHDERGSFTETYRQDTFKELGITTSFVQDNQSVSKQHVLRGLHYQVPPYAQAKLVRAVRGTIVDVAVDLRPTSPTYGHHVLEVLSEDNGHMLYIPPYCAHGFFVLSGDAIINYKCSTFYHPKAERSIHWQDPTLAIPWPIPPNITPFVSEKDNLAPAFTKI